MIPTTHLNEAEFANRLGQMATNAVRTARDSVLAKVGSKRAIGRLDLSVAVKKLNADWSRYVGRKAAKGDTQIKRSPTHQNLIDFLMFAYGIEIDDYNLMRAIGTRVASGEQSGENVNRPIRNADDIARDTLGHLKSTSPDEYNALKRKFSKSTTQKESVNEATTDVFNPRIAFPYLADFLMDKGLIRIQRGKEIFGAAGVKGDEQQQSGPPEATTSTGQKETASARVTPDGHAIDINKMKKSLIGDNISAANMDHLKTLIEMGGERAYRALEGDQVAERTMAALVTALLRSVSSKNDQGNIEAQHSITADGSIIDINRFAEILIEEKITGADLNSIRTMLQGAGEEGLMKALSRYNSRPSKVIFSIANAVLQATEKE